MKKEFMWSCVCAVILASCGGGGSGSSGSTPPPPPSGNTAPVASFSLSATTVSENSTFSVDASGSSDADGDTLTYTWSQTSGPSLQFSDVSAVTTDVSVPSLTSDTTAEIRLQVSDGTTTSTTTATVTLDNLNQEPTATTNFNTEKTFKYSDTPIGVDIFAVPVFNDETLNILVVDDGQSYQTNEVNFVGTDLRLPRQNINTLAQGAKFIDYKEDPISSDSTFTLFASVNESTNEAQVFDLIDRGEIFTVNDPTPCAMSSNIYFPHIGNIRYVIGKRNGGASLYDYDFGEPLNLLSNFGGTASLCEMVFVEDPVSATGASLESGPYLLAYDENTNDLNVFRAIFTEGPIPGFIELQDFQLIQTVPVNFDMADSSNMEFITSTKVGGIPIREDLFALVFSDNVEDGNHRLIVAGLNPDGTVVQETVSWPLGVPVNIDEVDIDGENDVELVITLKDLPDAVVFKSGVSSYFPISGPSFLEVGVGFEDVTPFRKSGQFRGGILFHNEQTSELKLFIREVTGD